MSTSLSQAVALLNSGKIIAVPTDTVYGIAASIKYPNSIKAIFELKKRPLNKALVIQIANTKQLDGLVLSIPESFYNIQTFWPGPLTIVFKAKTQNIPKEILAGGNTIGIRIANHPLLLDLISQTGPLAIPSANISDQPAATTAKEVLSYFGPDLPILDGGSCQHSQESTIISLTGNSPQILRKGVISEKELFDKLSH